jgi:DoxX-like family
MHSTPKILFASRLSLSLLWLFTAASSFWWGRAIGYEVLATQEITGAFADLCINAGSLVDAVIGLWLLTAYKLQWCYRAQLIIILSYTILLSIIDPSFWLHPFGPLTKNIPLLVFIFWLSKTESNPTKPL